MTTTLIKPPALEPVTLAEVRQFLRLGDTSEDKLLDGLIKAARETLEKQTGLALINQTFRIYVDQWPVRGLIKLGKYPVQSIVAATTYHGDGTPVSIASQNLHLEAGSRPARLYIASRVQVSNAIEVDFICGFGETGQEIPDALRHAILTLVAHWYEFRGVYGATQQPVSYPPAFERAVGLWRKVSL
ncbi:phage head-tail connector protein [Phyllobacterium sp. SB3]|uniref:head-tail connector protein n=1 Tax=Phyllobacterium sp. SB3 TaxID=3156073 RepID=UPI0032B01F89